MELVTVSGQKIVWVQHDFGFLGGSLGCAEGEKITRSFEYAIKEGLPVCVQVRRQKHLRHVLFILDEIIR